MFSKSLSMFRQLLSTMFDMVDYHSKQKTEHDDSMHHLHINFHHHQMPNQLGDKTDSFHYLHLIVFFVLVFYHEKYDKHTITTSYSVTFSFTMYPTLNSAVH